MSDINQQIEEIRAKIEALENNTAHAELEARIEALQGGTIDRDELKALIEEILEDEDTPAEPQDTQVETGQG